MPISYRIVREARLVITTGRGILSFAEARDQQNAMQADPAFDPTFDQLLDLTGVTEFALSPAEAKAMAEPRPFSPASKRAYVSSSPVVFGMGRLMEAHHGQQPSCSITHVFGDLASALAWLGLEKLPQ